MLIDKLSLMEYKRRKLMGSEIMQDMLLDIEDRPEEQNYEGTGKNMKTMLDTEISTKLKSE